MRWVGLLCVLGAANASGGPLEPKRPPATLKLEVLESFIDGMVSERWGDLHMAWQYYETAISQDHDDGTALFNHALLALALDKVFDAKTHFKYYLERTPNAPDRSAVQKIIDELEHGDPVMTFGGKAKHAPDEVDALIVFDGVVVGHSPVTMPVTVGKHDVERITRTTYAHDHFDARPGHRDYVRLDSSDAANGNVVILGLRAGTWTETGHQFATGARFALPKGHYATSGRPLLGHGETCKPFAFDVKSDTELTYVRVEGHKEHEGHDCLAVDHVSTQLLKVSQL